MPSFGLSEEEKIRTFFSEDYPQFLIEVYNKLLEYKKGNITIIKLFQEVEDFYVKVSNKYYNIDTNLKLFQNEQNILNTKKMGFANVEKNYPILKKLIEGRIREFLNNEKFKSKREQLQNLINQQPLSSTPGGGKRKTNKKKRVKRRNSKRKRKSKRVNRKM